MADPFISEVDLGNYLDRGLTGDNNATLIVAAACDWCRTVAEQTFNEVEDDEIVLDGTGTDSLLLPEMPVTAVSAVTLADEALDIDDDYKLNGNGVLLRMSGRWTRGRQNVAVTYSHGYAAADLPREVRMVALSLARRLYEQGPGVYETLGQYSIRYAGSATDLTNGEKAILRKHRRVK